MNIFNLALLLVAGASLGLARHQDSSFAYDEDVIGMEKSGGNGKALLYTPKQTESSTFGKCHLEDFEVSSATVLGQGGYGQVFLGRHRKTGKAVAIKQIKAEILNPGHVEHEETIHHGLRHPFVAKFHCTLKDRSGNVYFVIEYIPGKNLGRRLGHKTRLSKSTIQRYVAEIIIALEFIHSKGIVYRDLKASNILVSKSDHIKLIDFGLSVYDTKNNLRGFAGTLEYAAPEMAAHRFYGRAVDFYSLGILVFKLVTNRLPLSRHEVGLEKHEFLELVASGFDFPSTGNDVADDLIAHFCDRNPSTRYGVDPAYRNDIREHPFFKGFNWNTVSSKSDDYEMESASSIEFRDAVQLDRLASFLSGSSESSTTSSSITFDIPLKLVKSAQPVQPLQPIQSKSVLQSVRPVQPESILQSAQLVLPESILQSAQLVQPKCALQPLQPAQSKSTQPENSVQPVLQSVNTQPIQSVQPVEVA